MAPEPRVVTRPLALPTRCTCKRKPPIRVLPVLTGAALDIAADVVLMTWQCRCGVIHEITAADILDAA